MSKKQVWRNRIIFDRNRVEEKNTGDKLCRENKGNEDYSCDANVSSLLRCSRPSGLEDQPYSILRHLLVINTSFQKL